jgi:large-conductance mechanosensitive channel
MKRLGLLLLALTLIVGANAAKKNIVEKDSIENISSNSEQALSQSIKDSMLMSKLSADQLMELEKAKLELERKRINAESENDVPLSSFGIVVICLLPFLFVATIIIVTTRAKNRESQRRYDLYNKSLEMGQTVPEHFFDEPKKANAPSNLKKGILWLVVGLGIVVSFIVMKETDGLIVGIIPVFVGIGYLLVHKLDKPKTDTTEQNDEQRG